MGGTGFVGRHVVNRAISLGWEVTSLSLGTHANDSSGVSYLRADVANRGVLKDTLGNAEYEYVVNCGGYVDHTFFSCGGRDVCHTHFQGVVNLVEILNRDVLRAFVNIGSSDEYGNASAPQIETQREAPISPYALGKVAATHFLQMLYRTETFPATTLRLFLTYGPGQDDRRFLPQIIKGCLAGRAFPVTAGLQLKDFCFVQDTVDAVFSALVTPAVKGEVINIASGQPVSIRQMIETVVRLVGRGLPQFGGLAYRPGENMSLYADISKAKALLNWEPKVSLQAGLTITAQSITEHA